MLNGLDFVNMIESGRRIEIGDSRLSLANLKSRNDRSVFFRNVYDGTELVISNISDLRITGVAPNSSEIFTEPSYATVMNFEISNKISINNISIGHRPKEGDCTGGVLNFRYCQNIELDNLVLYGCGTYGVELSACANVFIRNTTIKECTYGILSIYSCKNVIFESCIFENNKSHNIHISSAEKVLFNECIFRNNAKDWFSSEFMINSESTGYDVNFRSCSFDDLETAIMSEERIYINSIDSRKDTNSNTGSGIYEEYDEGKWPLEENFQPILPEFSDSIRWFSIEKVKKGGYGGSGFGSGVQPKSDVISFLSVRESPSLTAEAIGELHPGEAAMLVPEIYQTENELFIGEYYVLDEEHIWVLVELPSDNMNGIRGWISTEFVDVFVI